MRTFAAKVQTPFTKPLVLRWLPVAATRSHASDTSSFPAAASRGSDFSGISLTAQIQRKPSVSSPEDTLEREADEAAGKVLQEPSSSASAPAEVRRRCADCESSAAGILRRQTSSSGRKIEPAEGLDTTLAVEETRRAGTPLAPGVRSYFEPRFGHDFSQVRVHADTAAARAARAVQARAYTFGHHIVFGSGEYAPTGADGRRLLAHELAHVVQQQPGKSASAPARHYNSPDARNSGGDRNSAPQALSRLAHANAEPALYRSPVKGNEFGDYDVVQTTHDGASATDSYWSPITITFNPNDKTVAASEIAFVQSVQKVDSKGATIESRKAWSSRETKDHSRIDAVTRSGWVGYDAADKPYSALPPGAKDAVPIVEPGSSPKPLKAAVTRDWPTNSVPNVKFHFESAAIAKAGSDKGKVYGAITWGFDVDDKNKLKAHAPAFLSSPSKAFGESVAAWNVQVAGPEADRMVSDQRKLGPFK